MLGPASLGHVVSGQLATHAPSAQIGVCPVHGWAQEPQWSGSLRRSTHEIAAASPASCDESVHDASVPHGALQAPCTHATPAGHWRPQAPQLDTSDCSATHDEWHGPNPLGHTSAQMPCEQTLPAGHPFPHAPQLSGSVIVLMHRALPHDCVPEGQELELFEHPAADAAAYASARSDTIVSV
jgi:hypothetical protein